MEIHYTEFVRYELGCMSKHHTSHAFKFSSLLIFALFHKADEQQAQCSFLVATSKFALSFYV